MCKNQEDNKGKCVKTVKTCEPGQDQCMTSVRWGGMPYWAPSGEKQYYISKHCATKEACSSERHRLSTRCERIWYNDWDCVECCHGDRCNYYVTLAAGHLSPTLAVALLLPLLASLHQLRKASC